MAEMKQENRVLELETPLGKDLLLVTEVKGDESLSAPFSFDLKLLSERRKVSPEEIIGKPAGIILRFPSGDQRFFHGVVNRFGHTGQDRRTHQYQMQVVPWIWLLTRKTDCRIFQNKTVPEIIKAVFVDLKGDFPGLVNFEDKTTGQYRKLDYCTQYRETDLNFVSRLMEQEGIYYFFKHERNKHTLIFADSPDAYLACKAGKKVVFRADEKEDKFLDEVLRFVFDNLIKGGAQTAKNILKPVIKTALAGLGFLPGISDAIDKGVDAAIDGIVNGIEKLLFDEEPPLQEGIKTWREQHTLQAGKWIMRDHHFEMPSKSLEVNNPSIINVGNNSKLELYDYPGYYAQRFNKPSERLGEIEPEGRKLVEIRMQEKEAQFRVIHGMSREGNFTTGHHFDLSEHPQREFNGRYALTSVKHSIAQGDFFSESLKKSGGPYSNQFTCIPAATRFRPPRTATKPSVRGPQTAEVVGPAGEEIHVDKFGRIKVQFHWDQEGKKNENSSCFLRVGQLWAGKQWGAIFIPRIGQEVIVDFLEGDPDQPIVIGSVYNSEQMPPYELPANKTRSGIKTRSSLNGTADNFNEFRFEDKKGQEEVYLHAERNLRTKVEANEIRDVGGSRTTSIGGDDTLTVGRNRSATIQANDDESVLGDQMVTIAANQSVTVGATISITAGGTVTITAPTIVLNAAVVQAAGVVMCQVLQTQSVVSPVYTPGVGNLL